MTPRRPSGPSLKGRALRYLSQREHSRAELKRKLLPFARAEAADVADAAATARAADSDGIGATGRPTGVFRRDDPAGGDLGARGPAVEATGSLRASELDEAAGADAATRVDRLLDELAAAGWLSDTRAAESLVSTKASRFGASRLRRMLAERGVEREAADVALEQARVTEFQRALEVWRRRFGEPAADASGRARQQRFLLSRGFPAAIVRRITGGDSGFDDVTGDL